MKRVTDDLRAAIVAAVRRCNAFGLRPDLVDVWRRLPVALSYSTLRRELLKLVAQGRLGMTDGPRREFWVIAGPGGGPGGGPSREPGTAAPATACAVAPCAPG